MRLCIQTPGDPVPRFLRKVQIPDHEPATCWLWVGAANRRTGYGLFHLEGRNEAAHRAAFRLFVDDIPAGQVIMHRCDVRLCVRPLHLQAGTQADNMRDKCLKGRARPGAHVPDFPPQHYDREPAWLRNALTEYAQLGENFRT